MSVFCTYDDGRETGEMGGYKKEKYLIKVNYLLKQEGSTWGVSVLLRCVQSFSLSHDKQSMRQIFHEY